MYENKTLVCEDCKNEFIFTAEEQEFYSKWKNYTFETVPVSAAFRKRWADKNAVLKK